MKGKISGRVWISIILFGLFGQIAWTVENMYFNLFLYKTISGDPDYIAAMVAASAVTATVTTLLMGVFSDRIGKRKVLICAGYILWGITTASFAFVSTENVKAAFNTSNVVAATAILVIIMDCIMTFFGSTSNDAAFNAWVTDVTNITNRGKAETVLEVMPLLSLLIVFGGLDGLTQAGNWSAFFLIVGGIVILGGLLGLLIIKDSPELKPNRQNYFSNILYGFRPSTVKKHSTLYITLSVLCILSMSYQVFMPYLIIYIQSYLGIDNYAIVLAIVLVLSSIASVLLGRIMDKIGKHKFLIPTLAVLIIGLIAVYFVRSIATLAAAGTVMLGSNLICTSAVNGLIRDETPTDKVGQFQGVRMIFSVLVPMVIGPFIGSNVIKGGGATYNDLGVIKPVPTPEIFLAGAVVALFALIPMIFLYRRKTGEQI
ncbi:MAG: MFS transporter [Clostridiales bacterium]|nr:MFS transporter [Clostridiales bacterium]